MRHVANLKTALSLGALIAAFLSGGTPAGSTVEAARQLAFVRGEAAATEIYVIREDGTGLRRLTSNRTADFSPTWSPDGARIIFASNRDGDDDLYVIDVSGRNVRRLTQNRRQDLTPQWSPDGRLIAFASDRGRPGEPEIWIMRADGSAPRRLITTVDHAWQDRQYSPTWSPDGRRVIFTMAATDSNPELYVVGLNGRGLRRLTRTAGSVDVPGDDAMPDWSSDGRSVVFVSNRERRTSDIWAMSPDGSHQRPLMRRNRSDDWNPRVSHDDRSIAFTVRPLPNGSPSVWLSAANGSGAKRLTGGSEPDWRP